MTEEITKQHIFKLFQYRMDNPYIVIEGIDNQKNIHVLCTLYYFDYVDMDKFQTETEYHVNHCLWSMKKWKRLKVYSSKPFSQDSDWIHMGTINTIKVIFYKNEYDDGQELVELTIDLQ